MYAEISILLIVIWFVRSAVVTYIKRRDMPPGPFPLPLLGNIYNIGTEPPFSMDGLRVKYGDVFTVTTPVGEVVIVSSGALAREALVTKKDDFAGRPQSFPAHELLESKDLLAGDYGPLLQFRRRILISALHLFGDAMKTVEKRVNREVTWLEDAFEAKNQKAFAPKKYIMMTMISVMSEWLFSERFQFGDAQLEKLFAFDEDILFLNRQGGYYQLLPFLKYFPTKFMKTFAKVQTTIDTFFSLKLNEHCRTYKDDTVRDITDGLLCSFYKEQEKNPTKDLGTVDDLRFLLVDVFIGSSDTSSSIVTWFLLYMIKHENIQEKIAEELERVVGRDNLPHYADAENLSFLQATICEVMRHSSFAPFSGPHKAIRDSTINGYHIPKDTMVLFSYWRIHYDEAEWDEPSVFKPERFINENGKFVGWNAFPGFLPFGVGRRACLGQALAKLQVFIITSRLLHRFRFKAPEGEIPTYDGETSAVRFPKPYNLVAIERV